MMPGKITGLRGSATGIHRGPGAKAVLAGAILLALGLAGPAGAQSANADKAFQRCAAITDSEARLACFDAVTLALDGARDAARSVSQEETQAAEQVRREADLARREAEQAVESVRLEAEQRKLDLERREAELAAREARLEAERLATEKAREEARRAAEQARAATERAAQEKARREAEAAVARVEAERQQAESRSDSKGAEASGGLAAGLTRDEASDPAASFGQEDVAQSNQSREEKDSPPKEITVPVARHRYNNANKLVVFLENGQIWRQKDGTKIFVGKDGISELRLKRGLMGSYFMQLDSKGRLYRAERLK